MATPTGMTAPFGKALFAELEGALAQRREQRSEQNIVLPPPLPTTHQTSSVPHEQFQKIQRDLASLMTRVDGMGQQVTKQFQETSSAEHEEIQLRFEANEKSMAKTAANVVKQKSEIDHLSGRLGSLTNRQHEFYQESSAVSGLVMELMGMMSQIVTEQESLRAKVSSLSNADKDVAPAVKPARTPQGFALMTAYLSTKGKKTPQRVYSQLNKNRGLGSPSPVRNLSFEGWWKSPSHSMSPEGRRHRVLSPQPISQQGLPHEQGLGQIHRQFQDIGYNLVKRTWTSHDEEPSSEKIQGVAIAYIELCHHCLQFTDENETAIDQRCNQVIAYVDDAFNFASSDPLKAPLHKVRGIAHHNLGNSVRGIKDLVLATDLGTESVIVEANLELAQLHYDLDSHQLAQAYVCAARKATQNKDLLETVDAVAEEIAGAGHLSYEDVDSDSDQHKE